MPRNRVLTVFLFVFFCCFTINVQAQLRKELQYIKDAYPDSIQSVEPNSITWKDGSQMAIRNSLFNELFNSVNYYSENTSKSISIKDLQCDTYEPFFKKMYGRTPQEVKKHLVTIYWMPERFGNLYPLKVTTVNGVDKKLQRISAELEKLPVSYNKYLAKPEGAFYWRRVAGEPYLSSHSFGIAIDINARNANYWLWDWLRARRSGSIFIYHNNIPMKIVEIFEKEGFLWGGRWRFYDTMHFEYRPELFTHKTGMFAQYNHELGQRCNA